MLELTRSVILRNEVTKDPVMILNVQGILRYAQNDTINVMPRKTKKQKLLADIHKKLQLSATYQFQDLKTDYGSVKSQKNIKPQNQNFSFASTSIYQKEPVTKTKLNIIGSPYTYVRNDLIRITIFTVFALLAQGVLYFLLRTR